MDIAKPEVFHTRDCEDEAFMFHAATGSDMECTCPDRCNVCGGAGSWWQPELPFGSGYSREGVWVRCTACKGTGKR